MEGMLVYNNVYGLRNDELPIIRDRTQLIYKDVYALGCVSLNFVYLY